MPNAERKALKTGVFMVQTTHADYSSAIIVEQNYTEARETSSNKAILRSPFSVTFYAAPSGRIVDTT